MKIKRSPFEWVLLVLMIGSVIIVFTVDEDNIVLHKAAMLVTAFVLMYGVINNFIKQGKNK
ncbi:MAG: hypothetical protein LBK94_03390 [Prevotellaceae bacterium]|jgi:hypothetical protein|nr:hypothetical protein [Prevotellaceae bacterium]